MSKWNFASRHWWDDTSQPQWSRTVVGPALCEYSIQAVAWPECRVVLWTNLDEPICWVPAEQPATVKAAKAMCDAKIKEWQAAIEGPAKAYHRAVTALRKGAK